MRVGRWIVGLGLVALAVAAGVGWARLRPLGVLERGQAAYERGAWDEARTLALTHLHDAPNDLDALRLFARASARIGRDDSAQAVYQRIGMKEMKGEDYYVLGAGLVRQEKIVPAIQVLMRGVRLDPPHPELLQELSRLHGHQGELSTAVAHAETLAKIPGWEARGELIAGVVHGELGDAALSAALIEKALTRDPSLRGAMSTPNEARKLLARDWLKLGKPAAARAPLEAVLAGGSEREASWLLSRIGLQQGDPAGAARALAEADGYNADTGETTEPAVYLGAAKCAECHKAIHGTQQKSRHARTFFTKVELERFPLPDKPVPDSWAKGVVHTLERRDGRIAAFTRVEDKTFHALVDYALGSGDRGLTLIGHEENGTIRELRLSHYNDGADWDVTIGQRPDLKNAADYLGLTLGADEWNACVHCHTTNGRAARERLEPLVADHGIGCERCHGPGGNHVAAVNARFPDLAIARPRKFNADRQVKLCGQCHSPKGNVIVDPNDPTTVRFQALHFVKSRCFTESNGALSCVTCHDPHRNAETSLKFYEAKCLSCHGEAVPRRAGEKAPVVCSVNPATDCITCHMPVEKVAIPHATFSDHHIRVHREKFE